MPRLTLKIGVAGLLPFAREQMREPGGAILLVRSQPIPVAFTRREEHLTGEVRTFFVDRQNLMTVHAVHAMRRVVGNRACAE